MLIGGLNKTTTRPNACKPMILTPKDAMSMMGLLSSNKHAIGKGVLYQTDNWTLEAIVNPSTLPQAGGTILATGNDSAGEGLLIASGTGDSSGSILTGLLSYRSWVNSEYTIPTANVDRHVAFVRRNGTTYFYADGSELPKGRITTSPNSPKDHTTVGVQIAADGTTKFRQLSGRVREIRIWGVARTAQQIADSYNQKLTGKEAGLVGYWPGYVRGGKLIALVGPDLDLVGVSSPPTNAGNVIGKSISTKKGIWTSKDSFQAVNGIRSFPVAIHSMDQPFPVVGRGDQGISLNRVEGTGSIWVSKTNTSYDYCQIQTTFSPSINLQSAVNIGLWVYIADQAILDAMYPLGMNLMIGLDSSRYFHQDIQKTELALNEWRCIRKPKAGFTPVGSISSSAWSNITWMIITAFRGPTNSFVFGSEKILLDFLHYTV